MLWMITNFCEIDIKFSGINQINIEAVSKYCIVLLLFRTHDRWIDRKGLRIAKIVEIFTEFVQDYVL